MVGSREGPESAWSGSPSLTPAVLTGTDAGPSAVRHSPNPRAGNGFRHDYLIIFNNAFSTTSAMAGWIQYCPCAISLTELPRLIPWISGWIRLLAWGPMTWA